jgi:EAL domain-containing protein (putative c-di-GMP-specific phosphodiesterase class I)/GGDEF domain-containing protein
MYISLTARIGPGGETSGGVMYLHALTHGSTLQPGVPVEHDTGLLERPAFEEQLQAALTGSAHDEEVCALVIVAVDNTRTLEVIGASAAADVVQTLGQRMHRLARTIDTVGFLDKHRLALFLRGVRSNSEALRVAQLVYEALLEPPVATPAGELRLSLRYGVALAEPGDDALRLIERASRAMSHTGQSQDGPTDRRNVIAESTGESVSLSEFQVAMSHGFVRPYAQPVVEVSSRETIGYRGSTRWHHQRLGVLSAAYFIDLIADISLAAQVDFYVARELAAVLTLVTRDSPLRLYTPVSRQLMQDVRVERYLLEIAEAFHLTPAQLRLQIPLPVLHDATPALVDVLNLLTDAGIGLALTQVERASDVDVFADRGIVEFFLSYQLTNAADSRAQRDVARIVQAAHGHGCAVGATGVRTVKQHDALAAVGCDIATGDFYGQPQLAHEID